MPGVARRIGRTSSEDQGHHRECLRRRPSPFGSDDVGAAGPVGTVLLVVIVVALITVVGVFVMGLVKIDEPAPEVEVVLTHSSDRMHAHIGSISEERPIGEFRLMARADNGSMVIYDSDGDAVGDSPLAFDLDDLVVASAAGPQATPLVYVDADGDGQVSSGDFITFYQPFFPPLSPFIDVTHGYKIVRTAPFGIPRDSTLLVVAMTETMSGGEVRVGDLVRVTIAKGSDVYLQTEGHAAIGGIYTTTIEIPMAWSPATYGATEIVVRPGEADEWTMPYPFKVLPENPVSKAEQAYYDVLNNPLSSGRELVLVHKPSNTVVADISL